MSGEVAKFAGDTDLCRVARPTAVVCRMIYRNKWLYDINWQVKFSTDKCKLMPLLKQVYLHIQNDGL